LLGLNDAWCAFDFVTRAFPALVQVRDLLNGAGCNVVFSAYDGVGHGACDEETVDMVEFLRGITGSCS
jgi:hypothetical protein